MKRSLYLTAPVPRSLGGFQQHHRNIVRALEWPIDIVEYGRYDAPHAAEFAPNGRIIAEEPTRAGFAARLLRDYLTRPPTVFLIGHTDLLRVLAFAPHQKRHRLLLSLAGVDAWYPQKRSARAALRLVDSANFIARYNELLFAGMNRGELPAHYVGKSIWLPCQPEVEALRPTPTPTGKERRCVFVSRIVHTDPLKGLDTLIESMTHLGPEWKLDAVGGGDAIPHFQKMASEFGVGERVTFHGRVSDERRNDLIDASDVLALPSAQEGFGIVFLEAMVRGRPSVGAAAGAIPEVLPKSVGEIATFGDAQALAVALQIASDRLRSGALTPEGIRAVYDERYAWKKFRDQWRDYVDAFR